MQTLKRIISIVVIGMIMAIYLTPAMAESGKVNINTATKEVLMTLKGVGDKIADRIIEYRTAQLFEVPEDIMKVKGIGEKVFDDNKDKIIVKDE